MIAYNNNGRAGGSRGLMLCRAHHAGVIAPRLAATTDTRGTENWEGAEMSAEC